MRVLHVDPATTWRGGERQVLLLAGELARRGHESPVVAAPGSPLLERARSGGLPVVPLRMRGDLDVLAIGRLAGLLGARRPDLLHLHTARAHAVGGIAARLRRFRPVVVTRRVELPPRGVPGRWKYRALADHFLAISGAVERSLLAAGVPAERVTLVPSALEPPPPAPSPAAEHPFTVGTLAAFTLQKDPQTWLETVRRVAAADPDVRFVWAGEGELRDRVAVGLREAGLGDRAALPGFLTDPEPFWRSIDVFLLPSAFEALGTVLLDALARGVPVVATEVGGIPETVRDGREGLLAPAADAEALARAILRIRREPGLGRALGRAGRERARAYELGPIVDRIEAVYRRLVARPGGGRP